jgi:hypothetical protein
MSFDWYKRLFLVLVALGAIFGFLMLFAFDVIKIEWISFMEIQPSYKWNEKPLPVPARSVPIDGPVSIPNIGAPETRSPLMKSRLRAVGSFSPFTAPCATARRDWGMVRWLRFWPISPPTWHRMWYRPKATDHFS